MENLSFGQKLIDVEQVVVISAVIPQFNRQGLIFYKLLPMMTSLRFH